MVKRTIYLHIGTPKTGTTSIQAYLANHDEKLSEDGCLVPKTSRRDKKNHTLLSNYCLDKPYISEMNIRNGITNKAQLKAFKADFYRELREEIQHFNGSAVVLSSEQCYETLLSMQEIRSLKHLFDGLADEIKILVYIREQAEMLASIYSTRMKGGRTFTMLSPSQFAELDAFNFNQRLQQWEAVFGIENIMVRIFDREDLYDNDVVSDFCKAIGIPKYDYAPIQLNQSLNAKQCEFLRLINEHIPMITGKRINPVRGGVHIMVAGAKIESPPVSALISKEYQDVFRAGNEEVRSRYFKNRETLFRMKPLGDKPLDQRTLLAEAEIRKLARQTMESHVRADNIVLRKCIAAIFDVEYEGEKISMDYVYALKMTEQKSQLREFVDSFPFLKRTLKKCMGR